MLLNDCWNCVSAPEILNVLSECKCCMFPNLEGEPEKSLNACKHDCVRYCYGYRCIYAMISLYYWTLGTSVWPRWHNIPAISKIWNYKTWGKKVVPGLINWNLMKSTHPELAFIYPVSGVTKLSVLFRTFLEAQLNTPEKENHFRSSRDKQF